VAPSVATAKVLPCWNRHRHRRHRGDDDDDDDNDMEIAEKCRSSAVEMSRKISET